MSPVWWFLFGIAVFVIVVEVCIFLFKDDPYG